MLSCPWWTVSTVLAQVHFGLSLIGQWLVEKWLWLVEAEKEREGESVHSVAYKKRPRQLSLLILGWTDDERQLYIILQTSRLFMDTGQWRLIAPTTMGLGQQINLSAICVIRNLCYLCYPQSVLTAICVIILMSHFKAYILHNSQIM